MQDRKLEMIQETIQINPGKKWWEPGAGCRRGEGETEAIEFFWWIQYTVWEKEEWAMSMVNVSI